MTQHSLTPSNEPQLIITATPVPDEQRIGFWSQHFGTIPQWILLEPRIFAWIERFCDSYHGGVWQFYTLSNGCAFMAPENEDDKNGCCSIA